MTAAMLGLAIEIFVFPESIGASSFRLILRVVSAQNMGLVLAIFGGMRVLALFANGNWPEHGPRLRMMAAGSAALIWGQMSVALLLLVPNVPAPSPGIPVYFALTIGELISVYRAANDAGFARR